MKSVGIITILKVNNYGAELQAYATQKAMENMGYDAEIIDYLFYKNKRYVRERISEPFYPYPLKNKIKEYLLRVRDKMSLVLHRRKAVKRETAFENFHKKHTKMSSFCYRRMSELYDNPPQYDVYCVGSDQVWNPRCYTSLYPYFLTFAPKGKKRFSYASSFGVSSIPASAKDCYRKSLLELNNIGVREWTGKTLVKGISGQEATVVCDPTILLEKSEWLQVCEKVDELPAHYLLVYELAATPYIMKMAEYVAERQKLKIVRICKDVVQGKDDGKVLNLRECGPAKFLYAFAHADFIVTNSFHGTVFSIIFNKDFYTVISKRSTNNSRQENLLESCGLIDRLIDDSMDFPDANSFCVDFGIPNKKITAWREVSRDFIRQSIEN